VRTTEGDEVREKEKPSFDGFVERTLVVVLHLFTILSNSACLSTTAGAATDDDDDDDDDDDIVEV
jgi:hypothetical protein